MKILKTTDWDFAKKTIKELDGKFKSNLLPTTFRKVRYDCTFFIAYEDNKLLGAMTYWIEKDGAYKIGDFDTACKTKGVGEYLFRYFLKKVRPSIIRLTTWDDNAESFWRYIAKKCGKRARKIGISDWNTTLLSIY